MVDGDAAQTQIQTQTDTDADTDLDTDPDKNTETDADWLPVVSLVCTTSSLKASCCQEPRDRRPEGSDNTKGWKARADCPSLTL